MAESPYYLRVSAAEPQPRKCVVSGAGCSRAAPSTEAEFFVEAKDTYGNTCDADTAQYRNFAACILFATCILRLAYTHWWRQSLRQSLESRPWKVSLWIGSC